MDPSQSGVEQGGLNRIDPHDSSTLSHTVRRAFLQIGPLESSLATATVTFIGEDCGPLRSE
jgi:hypothetical protein